MGRYFDTASYATPGPSDGVKERNSRRGKVRPGIVKEREEEDTIVRWSARSVRGRRGKNGERAHPCDLYS